MKVGCMRACAGGAAGGPGWRPRQVAAGAGGQAAVEVWQACELEWQLAVAAWRAQHAVGSARGAPVTGVPCSTPSAEGAESYCMFPRGREVCAQGAACAQGKEGGVCISVPVGVYPSTSSASRGPPSWCSVGGREYRQPWLGVQLTKCALCVRAIALACCPITLPAIPRLAAARAASCHAVNRYREPCLR